MNQTEERLAEEVRRHPHLYDVTSTNYKDVKMSNESWQDIAASVELKANECQKRWRSLRDRFVRCRKGMATRSSNKAGGRKATALVTSLSWLDPHVTHREASSKLVHKSPPSRTQRRSHQSPSSQELLGLPLSESPPSSPSSVSSSQSSHPSDTSCSPQLPEPGRPLPSRLSQRRMRQMDQDDWLEDRIDDWIIGQMAQLTGQKVKEKLEAAEQRDECANFGRTVADLLRRVAPEKRPEVMFAVYELVHRNRAQ